VRDRFRLAEVKSAAAAKVPGQRRSVANRIRKLVNWSVRSAAASPRKESGRSIETMPEVSVIIPAYNVAPYIGETLDSVCAQTFTDYEVIVINDGSPDTEELERELARFLDRINYVKQENGGASAARNAGLRAARGEFVAFLDADDLWLPSYLDGQVKFLAERNCDLVCADAEVFSNDSCQNKTYMEALMADAPPTGDVSFIGLLSAEQSLITSGVVVRRERVVEAGLFDEALRNSQDFDLWLRLALSGTRMAYQRRVLLRYRSRDNSLSGDEVNVHLRELRVLEKVERSYDLLPTKRAEVIAVIERRRALLEFELGKLYLARGEFNRACESFGKANQLGRSLRTRVAVWSARLAPKLMQTLYVRRLRYVEGK
jgi:glycosyltransferase involved in cell wall biosynthesis